MRSFIYSLERCANDLYLRLDEKYSLAVQENKFNIFDTSNNVLLSDILMEEYQLCPYVEDKEYYGIPTGQSYIDEDGEIVDYQLVNCENHPGRLKYSVTSDNILLSSLRLAKSPALNFDMENISDYVFSNGFYIFRVKKGWDKKFVLYLLRSKKIKALLDENIYRGIGISAYRLEDLFKIQVKNVSLMEQQKAIDLITPIENQIVDLKKGIKDVQSIVDEVLQKEFNFDYDKFNQLKKVDRFNMPFDCFALNPDLRFSAKFHRPAGDFVMQELLRITSKKFKHFLAEPIVLGASIAPSDFDENGDYYYISMATIKNYYVETDDSQLVSQKYALSNLNKKIQKNDIIMNRSGVAIGKVALVENNEKGIFADFTMRIRLERYNQIFAYYYMRSSYFQYLIEIYKKGLQNQNIFPIVVREFPLIDIPLVEQQRIVEEIQTEIDKQNEIKNRIAKLRRDIDQIIENAMSIEKKLSSLKL